MNPDGMPGKPSPGPGSHPQQQPQQPPHSGQGPMPATVNNTFLNANMTIQQLNIQNVGAPIGPNGVPMHMQVGGFESLKRVLQLFSSTHGFH